MTNWRTSWSFLSLGLEWDQKVNAWVGPGPSTTRWKVNSTTTTRYTGRSLRNYVSPSPDPESLAKTLEKSLGLNNDQADNVDGLNEELKDKLVMPVIPIWKSTQWLVSDFMVAFATNLTLLCMYHHMQCSSGASGFKTRSRFTSHWTTDCVHQRMSASSRISWFRSVWHAWDQKVNSQEDWPWHKTLKYKAKKGQFDDHDKVCKKKSKKWRHHHKSSRTENKTPSLP